MTVFQDAGPTCIDKCFEINICEEYAITQLICVSVKELIGVPSCSMRSSI